ncbi:MAG: hypothetical protein ACRDGB_11470 [Candidatus Limnocylindria bacterium]
MTPTPTDRLRQWLADQMRARRLSQAQVALPASTEARSDASSAATALPCSTLPLKLLAAFDHEALPDGLQRTLAALMDPSALVAEPCVAIRLPDEAVADARPIPRTGERMIA